MHRDISYKKNWNILIVIVELQDTYVMHFEEAISTGDIWHQYYASVKILNLVHIISTVGEVNGKYIIEKFNVFGINRYKHTIRVL